ncbi:MAG: class I SAM-dependent methyltransferase [Acidobacteria bacterium]|nr:class I SAM-dependent methyltransferase [Acidobacteriota bacterium]
MLRRFANGIRKLLAGLRPFGESVWPGARNDLFVAHRSIYLFFARYVADRRVLDAGCGNGYGSFELARGGAHSVIGVDIDRLSIRYACKHFRAPNLHFEALDCEEIGKLDVTLDVIVSSNVLEHLEDPRAFLDSAGELLEPNGLLIIAVPPILSDEDVAVHRGIHYHRTNLSVDGWLALFGDAGWRAEIFRHDYSGSSRLDFASPYPSRATPAEFTFSPTDRDGLYACAPITAVFVLRR